MLMSVQSTVRTGIRSRACTFFATTAETLARQQGTLANQMRSPQVCIVEVFKLHEKLPT